MANIYGLTGGCQNSLVRPISPITFSADADDHESITITWVDTNADYDIMELEYSLDEINWVKLGEIRKGVETYTHTGLTAETEYFYRARVKKSFKWSSYLTDDDTTDSEL